MPHTLRGPEATPADRRALARHLEVPATDEASTWDELASDLPAGDEPAFADRGEAIRTGLAGRLDAELLERERAAIAAEIERLPEVRGAGIPDGTDDVYTAVAAPGWRLYDHLVDVGFFARLDETLPRFTADHVETTARELLLAPALAADLDRVGFDESEKLGLLATVVTNADRLARWVPSTQIPEGVEFDASNVAPLHQRAAGGALLWIRGLDRHLYQQQVLITGEILDDAVGWVKTMLGGLYLLATGALEMSRPIDERRLTDGGVTATFTAAAAIEIVAQEELLHDVFYVTEEMRAPSDRR